ncbi:MAG: glycosyltransferase family 4 protein [Candidatus Dormibacteria bacterium]
MRIAFDARVLAPRRVGGTRTYLLQLVGALAAARTGWELVLYVDQPLEGRAAELLANSNVRQVVLGRRRNPTWVQVELVRALRRDGADVFHSPGYFLPLRWAGPKVVSVHDLNIYRHAGRWLHRGRVTQWLDLAVQTPPALLAARAVITGSAASARSIRRAFPPVASRLHVVPDAPDPFFDAPSTPGELRDAARLAGPGPFFLAVGEVSPQKRLEAVIDALAISAAAGAAPLVIVGPDATGHTAALKARAVAVGVGDRLRCVGAVPDATLRALYRTAACLVMGSDGEGFGLPIVEAMACGTPVLAASRAALPEVVGGAGWMFDPDRPEELAGLLTSILSDGDRGLELRRRSRLQRQEFSWERTAEMTAAVYQEAASR